MKPSGIFITGMDTGIGKTTVAALLAVLLKLNRHKITYFKPIQTGLDSDTQTVQNLAQLGTEEYWSPLYSFPQPIAPARAAALAEVTIDTDAIRQQCQLQADRFLIVEGAGGILTPISDRHTLRDLMGALPLPLLVVASTRLGTLNHTLLTLEAAQRAACKITGIVLNGPADPGLKECLANHTSIPILAEVPLLSHLTPPTLNAFAADFFNSYPNFIETILKGTPHATL